MRRRLRGRRRARRDRSTAAARCSMAHLDNLRTRGPRWPRDEHRRHPGARRATPCSPAEVSIACERLQTLRARPAQSRAITLRPSIERSVKRLKRLTRTHGCFQDLLTERFLLMASSTSRPLPTTTARRIQPIRPPSEGRPAMKMSGGTKNRLTSLARGQGLSAYPILKYAGVVHSD